MPVVQQRYESVAVDDLVEHPENPRTGDVDMIAESIDRHGFYGALVVQQSTGHVLAGNHRLRAARDQGITELPVIKVDVDDTVARRILLVDNRSAEIATWDYEQLASLLDGLKTADDDLAGLGWADYELEALLSAEWRPKAGDIDLEDYSNDLHKGARIVRFTDDEWSVVSQMIDSAREDDDSTDGAVLAALCKQWLPNH